MTYVQFKNAVEGVSRKFNWELRLAIATVVPIEEQHYPLFSKANEEQVFRMADALSLQTLSNS